MTSTRDMALLRDLLTQIRGLPPLSNGVSKLMGLNGQDPALLEKVVAIIASDTALATQVMKIANSAAFTGQSTIDSVEKAVLRVGVRMITGTVAQTQLQRVFDPHDEVMTELWVTNITAAYFAMNLAAANPALDIVPETAYTYALLHDVGRLVMAHMLGAGLVELLEEDPDPRTKLSRRERALFGFDHETAGRMLGNQWKLPPDITLVIAAHHLPIGQREAFPESTNRTITVIDLADALSYQVHLHSKRREELEEDVETLICDGRDEELREELGLSVESVIGTIAPTLAAVDRQRVLMLG